MKKSILAISEKKETLKLIRKEMIEEYEVITLNSFLDGLDMLRESDFDIIILDEDMSWFSYKEVKRKLNGIGKDFVVVALINEENEKIKQELDEAEIYYYIEKPFDKKEFSKLMVSGLQTLKILKEKRSLEEKISLNESEDEILGRSPKIREALNLIEKIAPSDLTVLITGEGGAGKELVAAEIFKKSERRKNPFVVLSCAVVQPDYLERELFGYEKDSIPRLGGKKIPLLEKANGGTLFIEEVTKLDLKAQEKLLKAIEHGEMKKVGTNKTKRIDVRFIVSTRYDLEVAVKNGTFRRDLYHRLTGFQIEVPPLRERKEDIPILVSFFLNKVISEVHREIPIISSEAMKYLVEYPYPGNVRELKNIIERILILSQNRVIEVEDLPLELKMSSDTLENRTIAGVGPLKEILEKELYNLNEVEKVVIAMSLQKTRWNKQEAAKLLGIGRTTLYEKIRKYSLEK